MPAIQALLLRLGAQSVTSLSTLRDPTQLRRRQCAKRKQHPFFCSHVMFESKELLLLIRRKELIEPKKGHLPGKKSLSRVQKISHLFFGKLTIPYVMFERKKLKFLLLIRRKEQIEPKKVSQPAKKVGLGFRGFHTYFWDVDHPLCDV